MRFDISTYKARSGRLDLVGIDFDEFRSSPLDTDTLRCLRYMHDVEHHTICYLRDLLMTRAHRDPELTAFLAIWAYEELWHGEAIGAVLDAHGEPSGPARVEAHRGSLGRRERLTPFLHALGSALGGRAASAVHMTWGAVNEWTTQAGYARLAARAGHPTLTELLRRIMRQEGRHIDVYATLASHRLAHDRRAQRLTRFALRRLWSPVGAGVMPDAEVRFLVRHLFAGPEGAAMARRIDQRIEALPGLTGLELIGRTAERLAA
jgi:hypothetical protein